MISLDPQFIGHLSLTLFVVCLGIWQWRIASKMVPEGRARRFKIFGIIGIVLGLVAMALVIIDRPHTGTRF